MLALARGTASGVAGSFAVGLSSFSPFFFLFLVLLFFLSLYSVGGSNKLDMEEFEPLINQSTDLAVDVSTNLIREFMKKFIFTGHKCCR